MSSRVHKFRAHSALAPASYEELASVRRMDTQSEVKSRVAMAMVERTGARVEDVVENMRRLCKLKELSQFFGAYAAYKEKIAGLLDNANTILRKLSPTFILSSYGVSEDIMQSHENFLSAVAHMNLRKQSVYYHAVIELVNKLPLDFEKFAHQYQSVLSLAPQMSQFEAHVKRQVAAISNELKVLLMPIEFDFLEPKQVLEIIERIRQLGREFELSFVPGIKERVKKARVEFVEDTEWHSTMVTLVPVLANLPMFLDACHDLAEAMPAHTAAIESLCAEIDELMPDKTDRVVETVVEETCPVDEIVERAGKFLELNTEDKSFKSDRLGSVFKAAEETVKNLRKRVEEQEKEKEDIEKRLSKDSIGRRLHWIRRTTNEVASRYATEKEAFIAGALIKLRGLMQRDSYEEPDTDPTREFNKLFQRLAKEVQELRAIASESKGPTPETRKKIIQMIVKGDDSAKEDVLQRSTTEGLVRKLVDVTDKEREQAQSRLEDIERKEIEYLKNMCRKFDPDGDFIDKTLSELQTTLESLIDSSLQSGEQSPRIVREEKSRTEDKSSETDDEYDDLLGLDVDKIMRTMKPRDSDIARENRLRKLDKTIETIESFDDTISKLTNLLDKHYQAFLPTSDNFGTYLDTLSTMKIQLSKMGTEDVIRQVQSLLTKSVELFNTLGISLSAASFAPEYSKNHKAVAKLLDAQQAANLSIARLRILLEEKERLLFEETAKLAKLEQEHDTYVKTHH